MFIRRQSLSNVVWYESPLLSDRGVPHAFSTRVGGLSPAPFDSLNLGNPNGCPIQDTSDRINQNYALLQSAIAAADRKLLRVHQVHGPRVIVANPNQTWDNACKADAIVVTDHRHLASVRVADCVPVLLAASDGSAVAAVHAGWRGVIAGVVPEAIKKLRQQSDAPITAAIGPCIGFDAFEVGPEVLSEFESAFGAHAPIRRRPDGKGHVDLRQAIFQQLQANNVPTDRIDTTDRCTFRDSDEFFSHRRENGITGRMAALIGLP